MQLQMPKPKKEGVWLVPENEPQVSASGIHSEMKRWIEDAKDAVRNETDLVTAINQDRGRVKASLEAKKHGEFGYEDKLPMRVVP